jgi:single-strand DNA-binding protein
MKDRFRDIAQKGELFMWLNHVILIGRLTRDPELRYTSSGIAVTKFTLAVDRSFTNQQGERETDFINIITWRVLAERCANYLKKGSLVAIRGAIQTGKYENQEGRTIYTTDIVADEVRFLDPKNRNESAESHTGVGVGAAVGAGVGAAVGAGAGVGSFNKDTNYNNANLSMDQNPSDQSSYSRKPLNDPFAGDGKPIDISDDDLPF